MYKKLTSLAVNLFCISALSQIQTTPQKPEWLNPYITEVNRLPARASAFAFENWDLGIASNKSFSKNFFL